MRQAFIVVGYNNTRIYDVAKIRHLAQTLYGADLILVKDVIQDLDYHNVDLVLKLPLTSSPEVAARIVAACREHDYEVIGILPFADKGQVLAAETARLLGLRGAEPSAVIGGLDKFWYREQEALSPDFPSGFHKVAFRRIAAQADLMAVARQLRGKCFVKPMKEGNSRGCIAVGPAADLDAVWAHLTPYHDGGLMAEELIEGFDEYSVDHVNGLAWVTAKTTTTGKYRAEVQQIVPAPLPEDSADRLIAAALTAGRLSGSRSGAMHNEIFHHARTGRMAMVEVNLRPAGMKIWDLAQLAFDDFNPWVAWLEWASGRAPAKAVVERLRPNRYVGIRMIGSVKNGRVGTLPDPKTLLAQLKPHYPGLVTIEWTTAPGQQVSAEPSNNADLIGQVIMTDHLYPSLCHNLEAVAAQLGRAIPIEAVQEGMCDIIQ